MLRSIRPALSDEERALLAQKVRNARHRQSDPELYSYLEQLSAGFFAANPDTGEKYIHAQAYVRLMALRSRLDIRIFGELESLDGLLARKLLTHPYQIVLEHLYQRLTTARSLFQLKMSSVQASFYMRHPEGFQAEKILALVDGLSAPYHFESIPKDPWIFFNRDREQAEIFYRLALERDETLTRNILSDMKRSAPRVSAIITGGFHSAGIEQRLIKAGYSVMTVSPNIAGPIDSLKEDRLYRQALENSPVFFENEILRTFLQSHSPSLPQDTKFQLSHWLIYPSLDRMSNLLSGRPVATKIESQASESQRELAPGLLLALLAHGAEILNQHQSAPEVTSGWLASPNENMTAAASNALYVLARDLQASRVFSDSSASAAQILVLPLRHLIHGNALVLLHLPKNFRHRFPGKQLVVPLPDGRSLVALLVRPESVDKLVNTLFRTKRARHEMRSELRQPFLKRMTSAMLAAAITVSGLTQNSQPPAAEIPFTKVKVPAAAGLPITDLTGGSSAPESVSEAAATEAMTIADLEAMPSDQWPEVLKKLSRQERVRLLRSSADWRKFLRPVVRQGAVPLHVSPAEYAEVPQGVQDLVSYFMARYGLPVDDPSSLYPIDFFVKYLRPIKALSAGPEGLDEEARYRFFLVSLAHQMDWYLSGRDYDFNQVLKMVEEFNRKNPDNQVDSLAAAFPPVLWQTFEAYLTPDEWKLVETAWQKKAAEMKWPPVPLNILLTLGIYGVHTEEYKSLTGTSIRRELDNLGIHPVPKLGLVAWTENYLNFRKFGIGPWDMARLSAPAASPTSPEMYYDQHWAPVFYGDYHGHSSVSVSLTQTVLANIFGVSGGARSIVDAAGVHIFDGMARELSPVYFGSPSYVSLTEVPFGLRTAIGGVKSWLIREPQYLQGAPRFGGTFVPGSLNVPLSPMLRTTEIETQRNAPISVLEAQTHARAPSMPPPALSLQTTPGKTLIQNAMTERMIRFMLTHPADMTGKYPEFLGQIFGPQTTDRITRDFAGLVHSEDQLLLQLGRPDFGPELVKYMRGRMQGSISSTPPEVLIAAMKKDFDRLPFQFQVTLAYPIALYDHYTAVLQPAQQALQEARQQFEDYERKSDPEMVQAMGAAAAITASRVGEAVRLLEQGQLYWIFEKQLKETDPVRVRKELLTGDHAIIDQYRQAMAQVEEAQENYAQTRDRYGAQGAEYARLLHRKLLAEKKWNDDLEITYIRSLRNLLSWSLRNWADEMLMDFYATGGLISLADAYRLKQYDLQQIEALTRLKVVLRPTLERLYFGRPLRIFGDPRYDDAGLLGSHAETVAIDTPVSPALYAVLLSLASDPEVKQEALELYRRISGENLKEFDLTNPVHASFLNNWALHSNHGISDLPDTDSLATWRQFLDSVQDLQGLRSDMDRYLGALEKALGSKFPSVSGSSFSEMDRAERSSFMGLLSEAVKAENLDAFRHELDFKIQTLEAAPKVRAILSDVNAMLRAFARHQGAGADHGLDAAHFPMDWRNVQEEAAWKKQWNISWKERWNRWMDGADFTPVEIANNPRLLAEFQGRLLDPNIPRTVQLAELPDLNPKTSASGPAKPAADRWETFFAAMPLDTFLSMSAQYLTTYTETMHVPPVELNEIKFIDLAPDAHGYLHSLMLLALKQNNPEAFAELLGNMEQHLKQPETADQLVNQVNADLRKIAALVHEPGVDFSDWDLFLESSLQMKWPDETSKKAWQAKWPGGLKDRLAAWNRGENFTREEVAVSQFLTANFNDLLVASAKEQQPAQAKNAAVPPQTRTETPAANALPRALAPGVKQRNELRFNLVMQKTNVLAEFTKFATAALIEELQTGAPDRAGSAKPAALIVTAWQGIHTPSDLYHILEHLPEGATVHFAAADPVQLKAAQQLLHTLPEELSRRVRVKADTLRKAVDDLTQTYHLAEADRIQLSAEMTDEAVPLKVPLVAAGAELLSRGYGLIAVSNEDLGLANRRSVPENLIRTLAANWRAQMEKTKTLEQAA